MPAWKQIGFAASAVTDLEEILTYYSQQQVPDVGVRLIGEIISLVEDLSQHPDRGRVVAGLPATDPCIDRRENPRAIFRKGVERASRHQALKHALVDCTRVHPSSKISEIGK